MLQVRLSSKTIDNIILFLNILKLNLQFHNIVLNLHIPLSFYPMEVRLVKLRLLHLLRAPCVSHNCRFLLNLPKTQLVLPELELLLVEFITFALEKKVSVIRRVLLIRVYFADSLSHNVGNHLIQLKHSCNRLINAFRCF